MELKLGIKIVSCIMLVLSLTGCGSQNANSKNNDFLKEVGDFEMNDGIPMPLFSYDMLKINESSSKSDSNYLWWTMSMSDDGIINNSIPRLEKAYHFQNSIPISLRIQYDGFIPFFPISNFDISWRYIVNINFYTNGKIKSYTLNLEDHNNTNMRVGTWLLFNEKGEIIKKIEHEKLFKTSLKSVLKKRYYNEHGKELNFYGISRDIHLNGIKNEWRLLFWGEKSGMALVIDDESGNIIGTDQYPKQIDVEKNAKIQDPYDGFF